MFWALIQEKLIILAPFCLTVRLLYFFTNSRRTERCLADCMSKVFFFLPSQGSPNFAFYEPDPDLA